MRDPLAVFFDLSGPTGSLIPLNSGLIVRHRPTLFSASEAPRFLSEVFSGALLLPHDKNTNASSNAIYVSVSFPVFPERAHPLLLFMAFSFALLCFPQRHWASNRSFLLLCSAVSGSIACLPCFSCSN
jgi:hypothetical protein